MKIYHSLGDVPFDKNTILSIGMFDGVHRAHQQIIGDVVDQAEQSKGRNFLVSFEPHPKEIVAPNSQIDLLSTLEEKVQLFQSYGIKNLLIIPFTYEFSRLGIVDFYKKYIIDGIGISKVIEGNNHHLGRDREGGITQIIDLGKQFSFDVQKVEMINVSGATISSSSIRELLREGNISFANAMLGRPYSFSGTVVRGYGRGKKMGYPTANIQLDTQKKLVPQIGVYAVRFYVHKKWYDGMMSIGHNPTFHEHHDRTTEVNIFDFDEDIYGEYVTVQCIERTRDEKKFSSVDELITAMANDKLTTQQILKKNYSIS